MEHCLNCGAVLTGKYCANCGQEKIDSRLKVTHIVKDATHGMLHWESSILKTLKQLYVRPGLFIKEYIDGKRKPYVKPFSLFIFVQTIFVIIFHWMGEKYFAFVNLSVIGSEESVSRALEVQHLISNNINYLNFVLPLIFAFYLKLFLKKRTGINYAEGIVFSLYTFAAILLSGIIIMIISIIDIRMWNLRMIVNIIYLPWAIMQFSGSSSIKEFIRGLAITILSYGTFIIIITIITILYLKLVLKVHF